MPFIRGRYYMNPAAGNALETARETEAALADSRGDENGEQPSEDSARNAVDAKPVRRIEIEVAELVPNQSGRANKSYIAHLYREASNDSADIPGESGRSGEKRVFYDQGELMNFVNDELARKSFRQ